MFRGWSIFDSLISLRQKLNYPNNINEDFINNNDLIQLEKNLSEPEKKEILKWLKIYGMPFLGNKIEDKKAYIGIPTFQWV